MQDDYPTYQTRKGRGNTNRPAMVAKLLLPLRLLLLGVQIVDLLLEVLLQLRALELERWRDQAKLHRERIWVEVHALDKFKAAKLRLLASALHVFKYSLLEIRILRQLGSRRVLLRETVALTPG